MRIYHKCIRLRYSTVQYLGPPFSSCLIKYVGGTSHLYYIAGGWLAGWLFRNNNIYCIQAKYSREEHSIYQWRPTAYAGMSQPVDITYRIPTLHLLTIMYALYSTMLGNASLTFLPMIGTPPPTYATACRAMWN